MSPAESPGYPNPLILRNALLRIRLAKVGAVWGFFSPSEPELVGERLGGRGGRLRPASGHEIAVDRD